MATEFIERAERETKQKLDAIRSTCEGKICANLALIVGGSFGRLEATSGSDLDYWFLAGDDVEDGEVKSANSIVEKAIKDAGIAMPSQGGAFGAAIKYNTLVTDIGGKNDTNESITRRVLFLTESRPVLGERVHGEALDALLKRYVNDEISEHQLALFFLNDVIRYWRTLCVDFENKVFEGGKEWGIRNIKLIFSRKLLYFGGVLIAAETAQRTAGQKRSKMQELISMSPVTRIRELFGSEADRALTLYDSFLRNLDDAKFRKMLKETPSDRHKHCEDFRCIKNDGQHFTFELFSLLRRRYSEYHPIYKSMLF